MTAIAAAPRTIICGAPSPASVWMISQAPLAGSRFYIGLRNRPQRGEKSS